MSRQESAHLARSTGVLLLSAAFVLLTFLALIAPIDPAASYRRGGAHAARGNAAGHAGPGPAITIKSGE